MASVISIVPIVLLFVLMLGFKMAGHKSALVTLVVTVLLSLFVASPLGMIPAGHEADSIIALTGWAVVEGLLKAVFPILIIILMAIHLPVLGSTFKFGWISNAGLMLFLGATIGGLIQGLSIKRLMVILARTTVNLRKTVVTICSLIALASVMNYSGMITAIASGLVAVTGEYYPLVAPMIGAIGTFVTGSDTSSNILFAKLQAHVANQLGMTGQGTFFGMEGSQSNWLVAANTTGATGGKMISPQSIAIATAACDMQGKDGEILRSAIPYAVMYIILGGLMVFFGC